MKARAPATFLSFVLCFAYFLFFPPSIFGIAVLIWIGTVLLPLVGRSEDIVTAAITTTVVFNVAELSSGPAWLQPIFRLVDTAVGIVVGLVTARISSLWFAGAPSRAAVIELSTSEGGSK
jgi:uncharacterized membrane protein YccC